MTNASKLEDHAEQLPARPGRRRSLPMKRTVAITALLGVAVLTVGCGGSGAPNASGSPSGGAVARALAYTHCMRSHGVSNFPDPTAGSGGGVTFQGSFDLKSLTYRRRLRPAGRSCRAERRPRRCPPRNLPRR